MLARALRSWGLPDPLLVEVARRAIAEGRDQALNGGGAPDGDAITARAHELARLRSRQLLQPVINATGVLLHTNLGRAPFAHCQTAGYSNVEFRLEEGDRGRREDHAAGLLARACGAEAALVVNNNAAAVLLTLAALGGPGRAAVTSRGELVEIGGGFRIPEVMTASGTELVEVGTTNRTRRADYAKAVADGNGRVALLLKVHQSNYQIVGFTESVEVNELVGMGPPVVADIGSGLLDAACPWLLGGPPVWLAGEPAARQTLEQGADLVLFSGDKLLGGPQAGIIAGRADLVATIARHPLARAVRCGALVLAALQELAMSYLRRDGNAIAFWRMATTPVPVLSQRAASLGWGEPLPLRSVPGGGTLPGVTMASFGVCVPGDRRAELRRAEPPIIARVEEHRTLLDLRTVDPTQDQAVARALATLS